MDEDSTGDQSEGKLEDALSMDAQRMFENIAMSKAHIKNQQRGEGDLTLAQKVALLREIFQHSPAVFLERFHPYICEDDLSCFDHVRDDYEAAFYLREARRRLGAGRRIDTVVKNRRYEALKKLEKEGAYFSDDEMRARDPLMYEQLIGQYLTDEELAETRKKVDQSDLKFSTILMQFMEDQNTKELKKRQQEFEDGAEEEEEEEEEEEGDTDDEPSHGGQQSGASARGNSQTDMCQGKEGARADDEEEEEEEEEMRAEGEVPSSSVAKQQPTPATAEEKHLLREEFCGYMRERFLSGEDRDFDYAAVDGNAEYDSLAIRGWDEEEKYFDNEEPIDLGAEDGVPQSTMSNDKRTGDDVDDYETWTPDEVAME